MKDKPIQKAVPKKRADQYDDPSHNYLKYWQGRDYENEAEEMAIKRLLEGKHFNKAVDVGGGFGRLCVLLENYADKVTLAEPSQQQLDIAKDFLKDHPEIDRKLMQADDLRFADGSMDLVTMIRVMHHLPHPEAELPRGESEAPGDPFVLRARGAVLLLKAQSPGEPGPSGKAAAAAAWRCCCRDQCG